MRKFQEHQQAALERSGKLKLLIALTISGTILVSAAAVTYLHLAFMFISPELDVARDGKWLWFTFFASALITGMVVAVGTLLKQAELKEGGKVIAEDLGGILLDQARDPDERRLLNIVEEMSVASGIPVPPVYLMESDGINAFAAGHTPQDCVLGVTRGAVCHLKRDELQGVIAHEFGHILNGDMALNMKLAGWLHGVHAVSIVAAEMMQRGTTDKPDIGMIVIGYAVWPIGQVGSLMSALLKSALNRQREFLADAYAVEFTRNAEGVANAMKRMVGHRKGGCIDSPRAIEANHMFFAQNKPRLLEKMATHPPIALRILKLAPDWDGVPLFPEGTAELKGYGGVFSESASMASTTTESFSDDNPFTGTQLEAAADGAPPLYIPDMAATVAFLGSVMDRVPRPLVEIASAKNGTGLALLAFWQAHAKDASALNDILSAADTQRAGQLANALGSLEAAEQLMVFDTAIKHVREFEPADLVEFKDQVSKLIQHSENNNAFHWMWNIVMGETLELREPVKPRYGELKQVAAACGVVLSQVCHAGDNSAMSGFAFQRGLASLGLDGIGLRTENEFDWETFEAALEMVAQLAPGPRRQFAVACSSAVSADREVTANEAYMMRGICQQLGYEMPCIIPGQPIAPGV